MLKILVIATGITGFLAVGYSLLTNTFHYSFKFGSAFIVVSILSGIILTVMNLGEEKVVLSTLEDMR